MSVSAAAAIYRVRVATPGATVVEGNVALTLTQANLEQTPRIGGPSVDLLKATTTSHPFRMDCIVDTVLFNSSGRLTGLGRLAEIQRSTNAGSSYTTIATGRISHFTETGRGKITVEVSDERWMERRTDIFRTTTTVQLYPSGLASAWLDIEAAGTAVFTVRETSGSAVRIQPGNLVTVPAAIPASLSMALVRDLLNDRESSATNSAGNFTGLRFNDGTADRTVISFRRSLTGVSVGSEDSNGLLGSLAPGGDTNLFDCWFYHSGHSYNAGDTITGKFYFPNGVEIGDLIAKHIGGTAGVHPMTLLKDILDGDYGGDPVRYDSTAMTALTSLSLRPVWARITEPVDRATWLQENIYKVYNVAPLIRTDLSMQPTALRQAQSTDPDGLTVLSAANARLGPWQHSSRDMCNVLRFKGRRVRKLSQETIQNEDYPPDYVELADAAVAPIEHDNTASLGEATLEVDTDLIFTGSTRFSGLQIDVAEELAVELFGVFGDGPMTGSVEVQDSEDVEVGDLVSLDMDTLKGWNPGDGARTGNRVVRLVACPQLLPNAKVFDWLDMGEHLQPLDAPTVSIAQNAALDYVDVTISDVPSGAKVTVEVDYGSVEPTTWRYSRANLGASTVSFFLGAASGNAYVRARSTAPGRISSDWATDDVALATRAKIRSAQVYKLSSSAVVEWVVESGTAGIRALYDVHGRAEAPTFANQADYDATDGGFTIPVVVGLREMISVQLTPYPTFSAGSVSGTAGDPLVVSALYPRSTTGGGGPSIITPRYPRTVTRTTFDANGQAVVAADAEEQAVAIYVTVGDGSSPSDPTSSANDGEITGPSGTVETGVKITTGNEAYVKAVYEDELGNLSPVTETREARRIGLLHNDGTTRAHTGDTDETILESVTVPAGTLGSNGALVIEGHASFTGTAGDKTLRVRFGDSGLLVGLLAFYTSSAVVAVWFRAVVCNSNAVGAQSGGGLMTASDGTAQPFNTDLNEDSDVDIPLTITAELADAGDTITLNFSLVALIGTS